MRIPRHGGLNDENSFVRIAHAMMRDIWENGGGDRNRTRDILLAKQALYQLSYTPTHAQKAKAGAIVIVRARQAHVVA